MIKSLLLIASVTLGPLAELPAHPTLPLPLTPQICPQVETAQIAPRQSGRPEQKWCCCGACCGWALSCKSIPGCSNCRGREEDD